LARPARLLIAALAAAILLVWSGFLPPSSAGRLTVTFIDVGQGSAALVEAPCGVKILVDGGGELPLRGGTGEPGQPGEPGDFGELGERVLVPFLRRQGIRRLDLVAVSHPHEDHFGGLLPLVEAIPVGRMLISPSPGQSPYYTTLLERAAARQIPVEQAVAGQAWACSCGLSVEVLFPPAKLLQGTGSDLNNNSLILRFRYGETAILFCGDIEDAAVRHLLRAKTDLAADILQVPHHGAGMASLPQFLQAVNPRLAVIPVGPNPFGHPHPQTLAALEEAGVAVYRTDWHGAVIVRTDGSRIWIKTLLAPGPITVTGVTGDNSLSPILALGWWGDREPSPVTPERAFPGLPEIKLFLDISR
jgi:competence protein ComEC